MKVVRAKAVEALGGPGLGWVVHADEEIPRVPAGLGCRRL